MSRYDIALGRPPQIPLDLDKVFGKRKLSKKEKEAYIAKMLSTVEGRNALGRSMVSPLRDRMQRPVRVFPEERQTAEGRRGLAQEMRQPIPLSSAEYDKKYREGSNHKVGEVMM